MPTGRELNRLFDRSPIGILRSNEQGRILYANPALVRMLGYDSLEELLALDLSKDVYADPNARPELLREHRTGGVLEGVRMEWRTRDGRPLIVKIYGHIVEDEPGEICMESSIVDITAAEAATQQLCQQREELERTARTLDLVVRQIPATYWLVDTELRFQLIGGAVQEVLGYAPDRWVGHTLDEPVADDGGGAIETIAAHKRALVGETVTYTVEYRSKQLTTSIAPYRRDGVIVGVIGTSIDVTAAHALERRMVDAQRAESLGVLAGGLAHDFNNLLVAILGNADLGLRDTPPGAPGRTALENIRNASLRAAELTDQLLAYAGRGGMGATRVDLAAVVDELLRISAPTIPANIAVHVDIPQGIATRGDEAQVRQVLLNLIANARDALAGAGTGGTISITGTACHHRGGPDPDDVVSAPSGAYVQLEIADDGPGIDLETRRRIFEPFFTTKSSGHGLGLAAVLGIVRAHRGGLRLISAPGAGARFQVLWPATTTPLEQPAVVPDSKTVLIIDDEDLVRDVVARMVEDLGYAALTAPDGPTGIEMLDRQPIDAVIVDLTMPRMNGVDVIAAMRAKRPELRIVLCTGFDRERRGPVKADAYLPKPFRIEALQTTLTKLLG